MKLVYWVSLLFLFPNRHGFTPCIYNDRYIYYFSHNVLLSFHYCDIFIVICNHYYSFDCQGCLLNAINHINVTYLHKNSATFHVTMS